MFNSETLKTLAHSNPTAGAVFLALCQRARPRRVLNISLLKNQLKQQHVNVSDKDYFLTFKMLEKDGIGDLIYGRKGNPHVFIFYYDFRDVAAIALGEKINEARSLRKDGEAEQEATPKAAPKKEVKPEAAPQIKVSQDKNRQITITIPIDLLKHLQQ